MQQFISRVRRIIGQPVQSFLQLVDDVGDGVVDDAGEDVIGF